MCVLRLRVLPGLLGTDVHSPGSFVGNERIPKKNRHSESVLTSYGFFKMGYFYQLVAGANLVHKEKVHFTLVQHRLPFQASVYTGDRGRNRRPDSGMLQHRATCIKN